MKDKEKQIESKALTLGNELYYKQDKFDMSNPYEVAEAVIDLGYRKIDKDSVVLSREELNEQLNEAWDKGIEYGKEIARKETAEKILKELYCTPKEQVENKIKDLARFIGVEIKE